MKAELLLWACIGIIAIWDVWAIAQFSTKERLSLGNLLFLLTVFAFGPLWAVFRAITMIVESSCAIPNPFYKKDNSTTK